MIEATKRKLHKATMDLKTEAQFFFFNDTATTEIYTLSLHDALSICATTGGAVSGVSSSRADLPTKWLRGSPIHFSSARSEEHTSELQSRPHLVCRLLLEKKKKKKNNIIIRKKKKKKKNK